MPAVIGLMIEASAVGAWIHVPLIAVVCSVTSHFAVFAIQFLWLLVHLLLVKLCVLKLRCDMVEEGLIFAFVIFCLSAVDNISHISVVPKSSSVFSFHFDNANELL